MEPKESQCKNCGSIRFPVRARGYCKRCYPIIRKIEIIKLWELEEKRTLKYYPKDGIFHNEKDFRKIKNSFIKQHEERLGYLKISEQILNGDIYGSNIVPLFQQIAKLAGSRDKDLLWHQEDLFDHNFNQKQKRIIYKILNSIKESIPWRGIDWYRVFNEK